MFNNEEGVCGIVGDAMVVGIGAFVDVDKCVW